LQPTSILGGEGRIRFAGAGIFKTYKLPAMVTRASNNYVLSVSGKLIPLMITNALDDKPLPVYGMECK